MGFAAAIPLIAAGLSGIGGYMANRKKNQQTSTNTSTQAPTALSPEYASLQSAILPSIMKRMNSSADMTGYETSGIDKINRTFDLSRQGLDADLTSRGLGSSPIAGAAMARNTNSRAGEISRFQSNIPMVQRQMEGDDLAMALQALGMGRSMSGNTTTSSGTSTSPSAGGVAGAAGNMASMLGWLIGTGAFGKGGGGATSGTPWRGVPYA